MPRVSKGPRYYKSKKGWYATLGGETVLLIKGPKRETEKRAKERYEAEVAARKVEVEGDRNTVWAVVNAYLLDLGNRVKNEDASENTLDMHTYVLSAFNTALGATLVRDLRPQHVTEWLASMRQLRWNEALKRETKWGDGTEKLARGALSRAFNWAVEEAGLISASPLKRHAAGKKMKMKRKRRRPSEDRTAITEHEHQLLVEQASRRTHKGFLHLITFMHGTGARPAEMYGATAAEWDETKKLFRIPATPESRGRFKLAHLGEDRLVYVPDDLVPLVKELMVKYPEGPLFRNERGKPWKENTLCARFISIKRAANRAAQARGVPGVRDAVTAYAYRHGFVTRWVEENKPLPLLCELLNTSLEMIRSNYSRLFERTDTLRDALNTFRRGTATPPATHGHGLAS
jgi:integrase